MKDDKKNQKIQTKNLVNIILNSKQFKNTLFVILIIIFIGGYALFFLSNFYMPTNLEDLSYTALNISQKMDDTHQFTVIRWDYSESQQLMEIELDVKNTAFDGNTIYKFAAQTKPAGKISVNPIIQEESYIVVQLSGIPKDFQEISFRISLPDNQNMLRLYSNIMKIQKTDEINALTKLEYQIKRIERNINLYHKSIDDFQKTIALKETTIANINSQNKTLESEIKYLTEAEVEKQNQRISDNKQLIQQNQGDIDTLKKNILEEKNKIAMAEKQIKDLQ